MQMKFILNIQDLLSLHNGTPFWDFIVKFLAGSIKTVVFHPFSLNGRLWEGKKDHVFTLFLPPKDLVTQN